MLQRYICALADPSVIVKTYRTMFHGIVAMNLTGVHSDGAMECQPAFLGGVAGN